jgi:choline dehydrogenase
MLGGTSSLNGMVYMRGTPHDYDDWRQLGCTGWAWEDVLPYFKKAQDQERGPSDLHGVGGPLKVTDIKERGPIPEALVAACVEAGIPRNPDFNGPQQEGAGFYQTTIGTGNLRWSTATAYLKPARGRTNLDVITEAHATKVLVEQGRAVGVEYQTPRGRRVARARGEVVVSGGVYGSPQLLMLSGIGPGDHLRKMGIPVVHDQRMVGANLQDHFNTYVSYRCSQEITLNDLARNPMRQLQAGIKYALTKRGPLSNNGLIAGAFTRSDPRLDRPDLQFNMFTWSILKRDATGVYPHPFPGFSFSPVHLRPEGRGSVALKSPDPLAPPSIRFDFLKTQYDIDAMIAGMKIARKIAAQPALKAYTLDETAPGAHVTTDEALLADLRERGVSNLHPVGTCRMGPGDDAVVDMELRVKGMRGLRVVDASIMPKIVAGNTNAPTIMIAEKASDMMLRAAAAA